MARAATQNDLDSPFLRLMFYGQPGSTKTRTAATAALDPRTSPALMLSAKGNPASIRDYTKKPDIIIMEELKDLNEPYNFIAAGQPANHPYVQQFKLHPPYKCIIVDGGTEIQRLSFGVVTGNQKVGPGTIPSQVEIQDFNKVLAQMVRFASLYFDLPIHVIVTTLEKSHTSDTGVTTISPLLWGQSCEEVPGYATIVGRLVHRAKLDNKTQTEMKDARQLGIVEDVIDQDTVSVALFKPSGKYQAKWQVSKGVPFMVSPTITKILDQIEHDKEVMQSVAGS